MKQKQRNEKVAESYYRQGIQDALSIRDLTLEKNNQKPAFHNIFLTQNQGKGPPGRSRSPGTEDHLFPEHPPDAQKDNLIKYINEYQYFNNYQKTNFYHYLIFYIMKKQFFIIAFLVLAAFANVTKSYGQVCTPSALNPAAGVAYDYEVTVSGTVGGTAPVYQWFVTQDVNLLTATHMAAGTDFTVNAGAGLSAYDVLVGTTSKINLTWTSAAVANVNPFYLAVKYTETSSTGCTVENIKVWLIDPINTFLLLAEGSDVTGDITKASTCPPAVDGALITAGTPGSVAYTYGQTTIYYKITASGAIGTWTPSISLPALGSLGQNYNAAEWSSDGTTWNPFSLTDGDVAGGNYTSAATNAPVTVVGSTIIVRVKIDNVNYESLAAQPIVLGADGVLPGGVNDIVSVANCADEAAFGKTGTHTVQPRPTVAPTTLPAFIPKNP